jgi:rSAM/selenodomain-associated transferase 2
MLASAFRMTATLSAVVPTLDEERVLGATLARLRLVADQIVVADGGSRDATLALAEAHGATVVAGARGRGAQLASGARAAHGDLLLFVHADTLVPENAGELIRRAIDAGAVGGAFRIRFDSPGWRYRLGETVASWRSVVTRLSLGDQAQFVRRDVYERLGGFRDWPLFEDYDFARRLRRAGPIAILRTPVVTSARRFERRGPLRTVLFNWWLLARFALGTSPHELARSYDRER